MSDFVDVDPTTGKAIGKRPLRTRPHTRNLGRKGVVIFLVVFFISLVVFLLFPNDKEEVSFNYSSTSTFEAELDIPPMDLSGVYDIVVVEIDEDTFVKYGRQGYNASRPRIALTNYKGKLSFDEDHITELSGRAEAMELNGVAIKGSNKISLPPNVTYDEIYISPVQIESLSYETSGELLIGDSSITLDDQKITISGYTGEVTAEYDLLLSGNVYKLELET